MLTSRLTSTARRLVLVAAATVTSVGVVAPAAEAALLSGGVYGGNQCATSIYVAHVGSEACTNFAPTGSSGSVDLQHGAFDMAADGYSALSETHVFQDRNGSWELSKRVGVVNSSGYGTTRLSAPYRLYRLQGATQLLFATNSCSYNASTGVRRTCSGWQYRTKSW